jgi:hypothetical protein
VGSCEPLGYVRICAANRSSMSNAVRKVILGSCITDNLPIPRGDFNSRGRAYAISDGIALVNHVSRKVLIN